MNLICIGKILKPYGLKGLLKVIFYIDDKKDLDFFKFFYVRDKNEPSGYRQINISSVSGTYKFFTLKLEGCDDRTLADVFRGVEIFVDESELPKLKEGIFYQKDLIGLVVFYKGEIFGRVINIIDVSKRLILIVKMENGRELAVPFSNSYIADINIEEGRLIAVKLEDLI